MELMISVQENIRIALNKFFLNKKQVRNVGMMLLGLLVLLFIMRACFFSSSRAHPQYFLIARNISWNDFKFTGKEHNVQAFAEELVLAAAKEAHLRVQFVTANPNTLLEDLRANKYDAVFTFMTPNNLSRKIYNFSDPLYLLGDVLVVNENSQVQSFEDMEGKIVGVVGGASSIYDVAYYPAIVLVKYDNINAALNDLVTRRIDGVILDSWSAHVNTRGFYADQLKIATLPFTNQGLRLATLVETKEEEDFIKSLNDGLERVKANGLYQKLIQKWGLFE